jgi:hypothetical protein
MLTVIREAAEKVGGVGELARKLGVSRQAIDQWTEVPLERADELERITGIPRSRLRPDLFAGADESSESRALYERDYYAWVMRQAGLLAGRRFAELDLANLVEEIEDLARSVKNEVKHRLAVLLMHLLKLRYQQGRRSGSWTSTIIEQRARITGLMLENPSLQAYPSAVLGDEYALARRRAAAETRIPIKTFPEECPFRIEEVLDQDFLPGPE